MAEEKGTALTKPESGEIRRGWDISRHKNNGYSRYIWHACVDCGKERWVLLRNNIPDSPRCRKCAIRRRPAPDRKMDRQGYLLVRIDPGLDFFRPMVKKNSNYIYEHRLVMAQHLQRCLLPWEIVHHRNGIRDDNRIENLQLVSARSSHIIDSIVKRYIGKLEKEIVALHRQIEELRN